jgi:hypothetical protein
MNQILLHVLAQDPLKTPGICLSFRWLLPLIPHLETICHWFVLPLLGTWLGCLFLDMNELFDQVFSLTGMLYVSTFVAMIPKPNTSSKLWFDANLLTIICYLVYFAELAVITYFSLDLEYSLSWLFSIAFSTTFIILFYAILLGFRLSTLLYFKTILSIFWLTALGNMLALGTLSPFYTDKILLFIGSIFLIYLLLPYRHPLLFPQLLISSSQPDKNLPVLRCLFWGALSVWTDYIAMTPFYILEMILASESHKNKDSVLYYCKNVWTTHKSKVCENVMRFADNFTCSARISECLNGFWLQKEEGLKRSVLFAINKRPPKIQKYC